MPPDIYQLAGRRVGSLVLLGCDRLVHKASAGQNEYEAEGSTERPGHPPDEVERPVEFVYAEEPVTVK